MLPFYTPHPTVPPHLYLICLMIMVRVRIALWPAIILRPNWQKNEIHKYLVTNTRTMAWVLATQSPKKHDRRSFACWYSFVSSCRRTSFLETFDCLVANGFWVLSQHGQCFFIASVFILFYVIIARSGFVICRVPDGCSSRSAIILIVAHLTRRVTYWLRLTVKRNVAACIMLSKLQVPHFMCAGAWPHIYHSR